jgi:hypothetical protein
MASIGSVDSRGFIKRHEHCNRVWPINHPDPAFPLNGEIKFNLFHPGHGSFSAGLRIATPEQHAMVSVFLLEALA